MFLQALEQQIQALIFSAPNKMLVQIFSVQIRGLQRLVKQTNLVLTLVRHLELIYLDNHNRMHNNLLRLVKPTLPQIQIFLVQTRVNYVITQLFVILKLIIFKMSSILISLYTGFGNTNPTTVPSGTVVKFTPVITTDSMSKNGISHSISVRHCCIASMKEYDNKSYEELRFEDYQVGRKGIYYIINSTLK